MARDRTIRPAGPGELGVYRLRDQKHPRLVRPIVVGDQALWAVGFVPTETYEDLALSAEAEPLS